MPVLRACRLAVAAAVLAAATMVLATPSYACACGAVVAPGGAQATMNHEVALVHWDGTTETVLMQLALDADTDNVALVVPTPTPATVAAGDKATGPWDLVPAPPRPAGRLPGRRRWSIRFTSARWRQPPWPAVTWPA